MSFWFSIDELLGKGDVTGHHTQDFSSFAQGLKDHIPGLLSIDVAFRIRSNASHDQGLSILCSHQNISSKLEEYLEANGSAISMDENGSFAAHVYRGVEPLDAEVEQIQELEISPAVIKTGDYPVSEFDAWTLHSVDTLRLANFSARLNYAIPLRHGQEQIVVCVFVTAKRALSADEVHFLRRTVRQYYTSLAMDLVAQVGELNYVQMLRQSRAAAISQVLARTLSHNLGSHSLNAFSGDNAMLGQFQNIEKLIESGIPMPGRVQCAVATEVPKADTDNADPEQGQRTPLQNAEKRIAELQKQVEDAEQLSIGRRKLLATYNNYLRERMDLLADITTAVPAFEMPKQLVEDLLKGYANNKLLATTIAGTGGRFRYCWQPEIKVGDGKQKDVTVAIPSDILGAHAFYLILENIVRNSAKHGGHNKEVVFTVKVEEETEEQWKSKGLVKVTITEECTAPSKRAGIAKERNCWIDKPVLDETTRRVREKAWGTLEMKAACAYLRRIALEDLDEDRYKTTFKGNEGPPLLKAVGDEGKGFGYEFYMQRPKLVMVCGEQSSEAEVFSTAFKEGTTPEDLIDKGIGTMTLKELQELKDGPVNHALLVYMAESEKGLKEFVRAALIDLAALPHEMVVVRNGEVMKECDLDAVIDDVVTELSETEGQSKEGIAHNATILKRSVGCIGRDVWGRVSNDLPRLYMEVRHEWLVGWMRSRKYGITSPLKNDLGAYLTRVQKETKNESEVLKTSMAQYQAHSDMESQMGGWMGLTANSDRSDLKIVTKKLKEIFDRENEPKRIIVQRYPDALKSIMQPKKLDPTPSQNILNAWAQNHLVSWFQGIAVIDERIQLHAATEAYQPEAQEDKDPPEPIPVEILLVMGGVFTPPMNPTGVDLQQTKFTEAVWISMLAWLRLITPMLGYVCIHLTLLEKFSKVVPGIKTVEELLNELRKRLPEVRIIVVSGRGKPPELPKTELFMSYSALSSYITQTYQRLPVHLSMLSHHARRIID